MSIDKGFRDVVEDPSNPKKLAVKSIVAIKTIQKPCLGYLSAYSKKLYSRTHLLFACETTINDVYENKVVN